MYREEKLICTKRGKNNLLGRKTERHSEKDWHLRVKKVLQSYVKRKLSKGMGVIRVLHVHLRRRRQESTSHNKKESASEIEAGAEHREGGKRPP